MGAVARRRLGSSVTPPPPRQLQQLEMKLAVAVLVILATSTGSDGAVAGGSKRGAQAHRMEVDYPVQEAEGWAPHSPLEDESQPCAGLCYLLKLQALRHQITEAVNRAADKQTANNRKDKRYDGYLYDFTDTGRKCRWFDVW